MINKTIQQYHQHLKAELLDRKILQIFILQLQTDSAFLCYLLFSSVGTIPISDFPVTTPLPIHQLTQTYFNCTLDPPRWWNITSSTYPGGRCGTTLSKNKCANSDFQFSPKTREAPPTTAQKLKSKFSKPEKLYAVNIATYTSITAGFTLSTFSFMIKSASLKLVTQKLSFSKYHLVCCRGNWGFLLRFRDTV